MNKRELIDQVASRAGVTRRQASRGVEAALEIFKRELGSDNTIKITGLGRLALSPKRTGYLPSPADGSPPRPIPGGMAVRLKATRKAVAKLNPGPLKSGNIEIISGGNMDMKDKDSNTNETPTENTALGLDVGTSRLVLANGAAERIKATAELNAFITVPFSKFTESILKQNKVTY